VTNLKGGPSLCLAVIAGVAMWPGGVAALDLAPRLGCTIHDGIDGGYDEDCDVEGEIEGGLAEIRVKDPDGGIYELRGQVDAVEGWTLNNAPAKQVSDQLGVFPFCIEVVSDGFTVCLRDPSGTERIEDLRWWIVLASLPEEAHDAVRARVSELNACGLRTFNDFSGKFEGFARGFQVIVMGPYADRTSADTARAGALECVPDAYVKWGRYLGE
jgi:hypothetical protein